MADTKIVGGRGLIPSPSPSPSPSPTPVPPYDLEFHTIFVRRHGSDENGDGSRDNPFRTFQFAIRTVPTLIPSGSIYTVDVTDLGEEVFPAGYQMPVILSPGEMVFFAGASPANPDALPFGITTPLNIKAVPKTAVTSPPAPAEMTLLAADYTSSSAASTGLVTLTLTGLPRSSWDNDALKGKMLISGDSFANCAIYGSDNAHLYLCHTAAVSGDVSVVEPSATFRTPGVNPDALFELGGGFECNTTSAVAFQGIQFTCDDPGSFASALGMFGQIFPFVELCDIGGIATAGGIAGCNFNNCVIRDKGFITVPASNSATGCLFLDLPVINIAGSNANFFVASVFDTCTALSSNPGIFTALGTMLSLSWEVTNCLFKNSQSPEAAIWMRGDPWVVVDTQINDSLGDAIRAEGSGFITLVHITGGGNGLLGIRANDGATVAVDATTNVEGSTTPNNVQSGSLGAVPYIGVGSLAAEQQYDLAPGPASNPITFNLQTGTRIFIR